MSLLIRLMSPLRPLHKSNSGFVQTKRFFMKGLFKDHEVNNLEDVEKDTNSSLSKILGIFSSHLNSVLKLTESMMNFGKKMDEMINKEMPLNHSSKQPSKSLNPISQDKPNFLSNNFDSNIKQLPLEFHNLKQNFDPLLKSTKVESHYYECVEKKESFGFTHERRDIYFSQTKTTSTFHKGKDDFFLNNNFAHKNSFLKDPFKRFNKELFLDETPTLKQKTDIPKLLKE